jgi:hypothetical protein
LKEESACIEQEIALLKSLYQLLIDQEYEQASEYFHSTCVVLQENRKRVFQTTEQRVAFLKEYNTHLNKNLDNDYVFKASSSKSLSDALRFSQLKLQGTARTKDVKRNIEVAFTLSSDAKGSPKIIVMVLDEF